MSTKEVRPWGAHTLIQNFILLFSAQEMRSFTLEKVCSHQR
jgi:hypothetical protein